MLEKLLYNQGLWSFIFISAVAGRWVNSAESTEQHLGIGFEYEYRGEFEAVLKKMLDYE
jgi:hypothetical protein